ncbi:MAG: hypothetical protein KME35_23975 [Aphanocapsa sp. GSE-SYN-MK-11-07L]|jgi:ubiquinone biosynthesis protein Coq4|nr:hypothetical protein [Aphanocapsa sp. GSE-SYN-MK-11-07L]
MNAMQVKEQLQVSDSVMPSIEGFLTLVNNPVELPLAFYKIQKGLENSLPMQAFEEYMLSLPEVAALVEEQYEPVPYSLQQLAELPEGTLGQVYATRMMTAGFDPNDIKRNLDAICLTPPETELQRKASYLAQRRALTHDIHHTVTNFGTDLAGELGLSALYLAQIHNPVNLLSLSAVLLNLTSKPEDYNQTLQSVIAGLAMGQTAKILLAQKWECGWDRFLEEWRSELGIVPVANP